MRKITIGLGLILLATSISSAQTWQNSGFSKDKHRQFDFWIGDWDVNLKIRQADFSWKDSVQSRAKIYPILEGRAVLELWNSQNIKGYSLRYYDEDKDKWVLWLNWPGGGRSGSSSLEGVFRHGRGEFFSTSKNAAGEDVISRYTFSDVTPTSIRWDDAFSSDGGNTWRNNWIMEFSRTADVPGWPNGTTAHTFETGSRCQQDQFRSYEYLAGVWDAEIEEGQQKSSGSLKAYKVLDGCAVIALLESGGGERLFTHFTFNTYANRFEATLLSSDRKLPARLLYGDKSGTSYELTTPASNPLAERLVLSGEGDQATVELFRKPGSEWVKVGTTPAPPAQVGVTANA